MYLAGFSIYFSEIFVQDWYHVIDIIQNKSQNWALRTKAVLDRTRLALQDKAEYYQKILQPTAEYLGSLLEVEEWAVSIPTYLHKKRSFSSSHSSQFPRASTFSMKSFWASPNDYLAACSILKCKTIVVDAG